MLRQLRDALLRPIARAALRRQIPADLAAGDVCSVESGSRSYGVVKVLAVDANAVHIRLYKQKFGWGPERIETAALTLGSITLGSTDDGDGFGIGHLPLARTDFGGWKPVRIHREKVSEEELEGYYVWQEMGGSVFGQ
jgi:hypothetical protein